MTSYIVKRILQGGAVLFFISIISFFIMNAAPGSPATAFYGTQAQKLTDEELERINETLGLEQSVIDRYGSWISNMANGDFGNSYRDGRPVIEILQDRIPNTLLLISISIVLIILLSVLIGVKAGTKESTFWGRGLSIFSIFTASIPTFWFAILCIFLFSVTFGILPSSGVSSVGGGGFLDRASHFVLPCFVIVFTHVGIYARFLQEKIKEEQQSYYVQVARANGVKESIITLGVLKNSFGPYINYLGMTIPAFFGGSYIVEMIFAWYGLGELTIKATVTRDYPLLMGTVLVSGTIVVVIMLIIDLISLWFNPRLRRKEIA